MPCGERSRVLRSSSEVDMLAAGQCGGQRRCRRAPEVGRIERGKERQDAQGREYTKGHGPHVLQLLHAGKNAIGDDSSAAIGGARGLQPIWNKAQLLRCNCHTIRMLYPFGQFSPLAVFQWLPVSSRQSACLPLESAAIIWKRWRTSRGKKKKPLMPPTKYRARQPLMPSLG